MLRTLAFLLFSLLLVFPVGATDNVNWTIASTAGVVSATVAAGHTTENFDLTLVTKWTSGIYLSAIVIKTTAANDVIKIRDGGASGAFISPGPVDVMGSGQVIYFPGNVLYKPYITYADLTIGGTATNLTITFIGTGRVGP
jgi:hypothetical protein